ncbi:MAG: hypothetical protein AMXMBFR58_26230 [Phycisphaerae bacterium]
MRLAHWEWMVRTESNPYWVRKDLGLQSNDHEYDEQGCLQANDPDWCFLRFGMSRTRMPDGRLVCIAGEHEDWYDPDFCIYNDVIVLRAALGKTSVDETSGEVEIYGYPQATFPPTDFHSATLVDDRIYVIGSLGYQGSRRLGDSPVFMLDTNTYRMEHVATSGEPPGWIYKHHAWYDRNRHAIVVRGGKGDCGDGSPLAINRCAARLYLADGRWEIISRNDPVAYFTLKRADSESRRIADPAGNDFRLASVPADYPEQDPKEEFLHIIGVRDVRIVIESVVDVRITVEGPLDPGVLANCLKEIVENLERTTRQRWSITAGSP